MAIYATGADLACDPVLCYDYVIFCTAELSAASALAASSQAAGCGDVQCEMVGGYCPPGTWTCTSSAPSFCVAGAEFDYFCSLATDGIIEEVRCVNTN